METTQNKEHMAAMTPWITRDEDRPNIIINDVTLRDGKQALPWYNIPNKEDSAKFVGALADCGVHHAEIGFPAVEGDQETECVKHIVDVNKDRDIMMFALSRLVASDIETAIKTLSPAKHKGIHTFVGISKEHLQSRGFSYAKIHEMVRTHVKRIIEAGFVCQFSGEDMTRALYQEQLGILDPHFVEDVYGNAGENGAIIFNHPDTLGIETPKEYGGVIRNMKQGFPDQIHATHTHNDGSMAEANTIEGVLQGAQRIEGTVCGIGERAGNADWMSVVITMMSQGKFPWQKEKMAVHARNILKNPEGVSNVYECFQRMTGISQRVVAPGYGFFSQVNRSGIHQAEVAKMKASYLWTEPESFGFDPLPAFDMSPLSGKGGVKALSEESGKPVPDESRIGEFTAFIRDIFSPDTNPHDIEERFDNINRNALKRVADKIYRSREEARLYQSSPQNEKKWMEETQAIFGEAYDVFFES